MLNVARTLLTILFTISLIIPASAHAASAADAAAKAAAKAEAKAAAAAAKAAETAAKIMCVGKAVNTREAALDSNIADRYESLLKAYTDRSLALRSAYTKTTNPEVSAATKAANAAFTATRNSIKAAASTTQAAITAKYQTAAAACKAGDLDDTASSTGIFSDDFNRPDSSDIGNGWNVLTAGRDVSSGIASGHVVFKGDNNGGQTLVRSNISTDSGIYIETEFQWAANGWYSQGIGIRGSSEDNLGYAFSMATKNNTDNIHIIDNRGVSLATGSFTFNSSDHYTARVEIDANYHMNVYLWDSTNSTKPTTPTLSFLNGGNSYTPVSTGNYFGINLESDIYPYATSSLYRYEVGYL